MEVSWGRVRTGLAPMTLKIVLVNTVPCFISEGKSLAGSRAVVSANLAAMLTTEPPDQ